MGRSKSRTRHSAPDAAGGKKKPDELSYSLYKNIKSRVRDLEKAVADAVTSSNSEQKAEQINKDKKAVSWWKEALDRITALRTPNNTRNSDQVRLVESCVIGRDYSEKVEKLVDELTVCRRTIDVHKKRLEKLESDSLAITAELAATHERFRGELKKMLTAEL